LVDETARTLGRYDDPSLLQFQSFLGRFFSRILVKARFSLHFIPALPVCEIKKMEIESLPSPPCLCPEIVYRFKISNFYSYCMTILIHFLQPSSCEPIVMEKSPHSSSLLLSMAFSRSDLQKQTWFQLTDRRQAPVSCQTSSRVSYKAGYELRSGHSSKQICNEGAKGISWWSGRWPSGRVLIWEDYDFPWLPAIFSPQAALAS